VYSKPHPLFNEYYSEAFFDGYNGYLTKMPFRLDHMPDQDPTSEGVIIELLKHGHIWEANTLLAIYLRHARPTGLELPRILDAVPDENDTMYDLVRLTMLVSCSRFLLRQRRQVLMTTNLYNRCEEFVQESSFFAMDGITDPISSSRAFQDFRLLRLEVWDLGPPSNDWERDGTRDIRERALSNNDYMLILASSEQGADSLGDIWLESTGASREAISRLHPHATLSEEEFHAAKSDPGYSLLAADDILNIHKGKIAQNHWEFGSTSTEMDPDSEPWNG
jgi:hypothetical protein